MDYKSKKEKAVDLRKEGYSYKYISEKTGVAKSTLSNWLTDISYKANKETVDKVGRARAASIETKRRLKMESIERAGKQAAVDIEDVSQRDLFMLGLGIYIGEGTKTADVIRIINANPKIIKLSIRWFKEVIGLSDKNITLRMYLYPDNNENECRNFWKKETGLSDKNFLSTQFDHRKNKKIKKRNKLEYGTVHLGVRGMGNKDFGVYLFRLIEAWQKRVL